MEESREGVSADEVHGGAVGDERPCEASLNPRLNVTVEWHERVARRQRRQHCFPEMLHAEGDIDGADTDSLRGAAEWFSTVVRVEGMSKSLIGRSAPPSA